MPIYRATSATVTKIMTGQINAHAFILQGFQTGTGYPNDARTFPSPSGIFDRGPNFRGRIDLANLKYVPASPSLKKYWAEIDKPGVCLEVTLPNAWSVFTNDNFECSIPNSPKAAATHAGLLAQGWIVVANPVDAANPAANNPHLN
jgi:hypothetical protein